MRLSPETRRKNWPLSPILRTGTTSSAIPLLILWISAPPTTLTRRSPLPRQKPESISSAKKPLALTSEEAKQMYLTAKENHVKTMVAFNYRRTPAVQLAKKYIDEGAIGEILDFRGTYLQDWSADPDSPLSWRFQKAICGSGALGDIGTHVVDMLRFLVGDFKRVNARAATYIKERPLPVRTFRLSGKCPGTGGNSQEGRRRRRSVHFYGGMRQRSLRQHRGHPERLGPQQLHHL